ncbi:hypothetical protein KFO32_16665 [Pantoea ananatis]|uniref:hypothetical protein n=1 Tax=Pantoea ananas TaxID=553 RepID=UPI001FF2D5A6|nr:hypothetical protein [Pantoea ananatis]MCK0554675.1 hypothetical protein [Pantoea ananatis]
MENNKLSDVNSKSGSELIAIAHGIAANFESPATELLRELASRLECSIIRGDELQQKLDALAAENAALKAGVTYFACGSEYGFDLFRDKQAAIDVCLEEIDLHREGYLDGDGWDDDVRKTAWGVVIQSAQGRDAQGLHTSDSRHTYQTCDYRLEDEVETPATDAYLNSVRAEGVQDYANDLRTAAIAAKENGHDLTYDYLSSESDRAEKYAQRLRSGTHDTADKAGAK